MLIELGLPAPNYHAMLEAFKFLFYIRITKVTRESTNTFFFKIMHTYERKTFPVPVDFPKVFFHTNLVLTIVRIWKKPAESVEPFFEWRSNINGAI